MRPNSPKKLSPSPHCNLRNFGDFVPENPQTFLLSPPRRFPNLPRLGSFFPVPENWGISGNSPKFPKILQFNICQLFLLLLLKNELFNQNCLQYSIFGHNFFSFLAIRLFYEAVLFFHFGENRGFPKFPRKRLPSPCL